VKIFLNANEIGGFSLRNLLKWFKTLEGFEDLDSKTSISFRMLSSGYIKAETNELLDSNSGHMIETTNL
jgi:hypothetical protein